jgi:hypothetical protein
MCCASQLTFPTLLAIVLCAVTGCGNSRPKTIAVQGQVTLNGGKWPASGLIAFRPLKPAEGHPSRPGRASFDQEGKFVAGTYDPHDGLIPGEYDVLILCAKRPAAANEGTQGDESYVGHDKLMIPTEAAQPIEYKFDLKN